MMSAYHAGTRSNDVTVRLVTQPGGSRSSTSTRRVPAQSARSLKAWIVRSIMFATAGFALLDLFLLATGAHH
jgi:hypothetical protein